MQGSSLAEPVVILEQNGEGRRLVLAGAWTLRNGRAAAERMDEAFAGLEGKGRVVLDLAKVESLDTLGAHLINRLADRLKQAGGTLDLQGVDPERAILIKETVTTGERPPKRREASSFYGFLADIGGSVVESAQDLRNGTSFLGSFMVALGSALANPRRFRINALVKQLEQVAFRGVPIVVLISFLVGAIVAQQGVFQMERFGAVIYVVDLLGVLILRELSVLLTSIMIAGRSGSAFTAEIGSMKMREEIDALRTMGLDPMEVLIVPRVLALIIGLPMLAFISAMSALFGGGLTVIFYGNISPDVLLGRLQSAIGLNTFLVGLIKAPFMALVIGLIASMEGMKVQGSAESLGRQTTTSVVKAIFMVIVVDGLFAMFFAAIRY
jgi:phospholipid/cholesterol/gamma-HCH transport system permease protein